jgi:nitrogen-specific signal transduction histidine kinase/CheY-like chemotaxis protein
MSSELRFATGCLEESDQTSVRAMVQQERLRALGQMASGLAHDLNNSLTPIIGYSDFLLEGHSGLSEESKKYMQCIRDAAGDIVRMVERLREFYRRREELEPFERVDLNTLVKQVIEAMRPQWLDAPQTQGLVIKVETQLAKNLPEILGNESELRKALGQLILNAIDALPEGGTIRLTTRPADPDVSTVDPSSAVILECRDDGLGMDETVQQRCLEPFFTTKAPRGTGLGLAMVYGITRRHDASLEIESAPGYGTTVRLIFNGITPPQPAPPLGSGKANSSSLRILCIDDDHRISTMLQEVLTSEHHVVEVANGGAKGVEAFRRALQKGRPFQVIITDLGMPNVDGRQIVRTVKKESPDTPIIMLTGWAAMLDQEADLPPGVDALVTKPPSMDRLHEVLAQVTLSKSART